MKKYRYIVLVLPFLIAFNWAETDCLDKFNKVVEYYKKGTKEKSYTKFSFYSIEEGGEKSPEVISEIWKDGVKYKMNNPMMSAFQDAATVIMISKSKSTISIYPNVNGNKGAGKAEALSTNFMYAFTKDSIQKYFDNVTCKEVGNTGELKVDIKQSYAEKLGYSAMIYKYDNKLQQIKENILEIENDGVISSAHYKYLIMTSNFPETVLATNVLSQIYDDGVLRKEYSGYKVIDYRKKNNK